MNMSLKIVNWHIFEHSTAKFGLPSVTEIYSPFILDLENIPDGGYYFEVELVDWANNTNYYTYR